MRRATYGRCRPCDVIFKWEGRPLLRDALCPNCKRPLDRTAANLVKNVTIVNETPLEKS